MTKKEQRSIELARDFMWDDLSVDEARWHKWLPKKTIPLRPDQVTIVKRYAGGQQSILAEAMFLLHHGHGITLPQIEAVGFVCDDVVNYARLLHGYRQFTLDMAQYREDLLYGNDHRFPLLTLKELCDEGYADLAEILRQSIVAGWLAGKNHLPPGMRVAEYSDEELQRLAKYQPDSTNLKISASFPNPSINP